MKRVVLLLLLAVLAADLEDDVARRNTLPLGTLL